MIGAKVINEKKKIPLMESELLLAAVAERF